MPSAPLDSDLGRELNRSGDRQPRNPTRSHDWRQGGPMLVAKPPTRGPMLLAGDTVSATTPPMADASMSRPHRQCSATAVVCGGRTGRAARRIWSGKLWSSAIRMRSAGIGSGDQHVEPWPQVLLAGRRRHAWGLRSKTRRPGQAPAASPQAIRVVQSGPRNEYGARRTMRRSRSWERSSTVRRSGSSG